MGIVQRQGIKGAIAAYVGVVIGAFNLLWLYPYCLSSAEIGLLGVLMDVSVIFMPFVLLGSPAIGIRYFPHFKNDAAKHQGFLVFLLLLPAVGFLLFSILFYSFIDDIQALFAAKSPEFAQYMVWVLPLCFCIVFYAIFETYSRSLKRIVVPNLIKEVGIRLGMTIIVLLYFGGVLSLKGLLNAYVVVYAMAVLLAIAYVKYLKQLFLTFNWQSFDRSTLQDMGIYAAFVVFGGMGSMLVGKIDSIMVASLEGLSANGIYRIAFFIGVIIEIPRRALSQISAPIIAEKLKEQQFDAVAELYQKVSINQLIVGLWLFIGIWINIDNLFALMPNSEVYKTGKYVVLFIGMAKLFDMVTSINTEIIELSKYYRYNIVLLVILALLTVLTNYWLIPLYGIVGAAMATALTLLVFNVLKFMFVYLTMRLQPFSWATLKALCIAAIVYGTNAYIPIFEHIFVDIFCRSVFITLLFIGLMFIFKVSDDINKLFISILQKKNNK